MSDSQDQTKTSTDRPKWVCRNILSTDVEQKDSESAPGDASKAILVPLVDLWDNGTVLDYAFMKDPGTNVQQNKVDTLVKEWEKYTNIKFRRVNNPNDATIRISFTVGGDDGGNWSWLPKQIRKISKSENTMNLEDVESKTNEPTDWERATILHEFGHTLGLEHEHQSPARKGLLDWREQVVINHYRRVWTEEQVRYQILNVLGEKNYSNYTKLDFKSIMMYPTEAFLNYQNINIPDNTKLSETDKAFMQIHYPFFGGGNPEGISFTDSLRIMGVDGSNKDKLLQRFGNGQWKEIREDFRAISLALRAAGK